MMAGEICLVSNGIVRDIRDNDFNREMNRKIEEKRANSETVSVLELVREAPSTPIENFVYRNEGNLEFAEKIDEWGMGEKGFSQGAAYADFDNDGDIDLVTNNTNDYPISLSQYDGR